MRIIPAIDIMDGKCVRLTKGNYGSRKLYNNDPLELAKSFEGIGINYLHLVDLDGAKAQCIVNYKILEKLATNTKLKIDFGGGLKSDKDLTLAFEYGANQVIIGSVAVKKPDLFIKWLKDYGSNKIILGADVKKNKIAINGWTETSDEEILSFVTKYLKVGVKYVLCTDIDKDGMLEGPSFKLYQSLIEKCHNIKLIASGGVSGINELLFLSEMGCEAVIIGKALFENRISLKNLKDFIK